MTILTTEQFNELHKNREFIKTPERLKEVYDLLENNDNVIEMVRLIDEETYNPCIGFTDKRTNNRYMVTLELQQSEKARMYDKRIG